LKKQQSFTTCSSVMTTPLQFNKDLTHHLCIYIEKAFSWKMMKPVYSYAVTLFNICLTTNLKGCHLTNLYEKINKNAFPFLN